MSGVPQGSTLSPTFYIIYTPPTPSPTRDSNYAMNADDITQKIAHHSPRNQFLRLATDRAITEINNFEATWEIRTNKNKFVIIPVARTKPSNPNLENINGNYAKEGKLLRLKITNTGIYTTVKELTKLASSTLTKLKRFSNCRKEVKLKLYKTLVRPILKFPPVPLNTIAISSWYKI